MRDRKTLVLAFLLGTAVFIVPAGMLMSRGPCVETTDFHMEPNVVRPDQKFFAVWTDKKLRDCGGTVNRRFISTNGIDVWVFPPVHTVRLDKPLNRFHTPWVAPDAPPGTTLVFRKDISRWANFVQKWLWPMWEAQEAEFVVVESAQEQRRP